MKIKDIILFLLGILFLTIAVVAYISAFYSDYPGKIFWACYFVILLMGIGFLRKNSTLILAQINIVAIALILWTIDFSYVFFVGSPFLGITDYLFLPGPLMDKLVSSQHLFTLPFAVWGLYLIKIKRNDVWIISYVEMIIIFIVSRLFTSREYNVNCVYDNCMNFYVGSGDFYVIVWFLLTFLAVVVTNWFFMRMSFLRK